MDIAIFLFDKSTNMAKPWAESGFLCYCVDIQHEKGEHREGNIIRVGADINHWIPPRGNIVFGAFFPPCTDVAVSGARWFKGKGLRALERAISLFARSQEIADTLNCPWLMENPVSTISSYWRKPDHTFDPCEYAGYLNDPDAEAYTKKTCLWTSSNFIMPPKKEVEASMGSKMHLLPPSEDRANIRSVTPMGFAKAVYKFNRPESSSPSTYRSPASSS